MHPAIERLQRLSARRADVIRLAGGLPDETLFPVSALARAATEAMQTAQALQYGWPEGSVGLRGFVADRLRRRGASVQPDDVIITSGAQQALSIASHVLIGRGTRVDVGRRAYPAALELFRGHGAVLVDGDCEPSGSATAVHYVMPGVSNPDGVDTTTRRRARLLASPGAIIADEAYAELRFDGTLPRPFLVDVPERTWHVGTFSKTLCPGLRVGFLVPPRAHRLAVLAAKEDADLQAGSLAQTVLERFLAVDDFDARLERTRAVYQARAARLFAAVRRWLPEGRVVEPEGGFSLFVDLGTVGDDVRLLALAIRRGVAFDPGRLFVPKPERGRLSFRLCHSAAPISDLDEGVRRLSLALADLASEVAGRLRLPGRATATSRSS